MCKAHLLIPEVQENIMYSWLINFQYVTEYYYEMYKDSKEIEDESDIYIFSDPTWSHPDHPLGLTFFDPDNNCAAILGMRCFGEHKKGTLILAWGVANRHGYAACHGGQKRYNLSDGSKFVLGVFGLSGSGKSTITHADAAYKEQFIARINDRIGFIEKKAMERGGYDELPAEAVERMKSVAEQAAKL